MEKIYSLAFIICIFTLVSCEKKEEIDELTSNREEIPHDNTDTSDKVAPQIATSLIWMESSPNSNPNFTLSWAPSTSSDLKSQKVNIFNDSNCSNLLSSSEVSDSTNQFSLTATGISQDLTFNIESYDHANNSSLSNCSTNMQYTHLATSVSYTPLGVGGGGAMSGLAFSPYSKLQLVGTDMGTLFRSVDHGLSWQPINHTQTVFNSHLPYAVSPGFSSDGQTVFHAPAGIKPVVSRDQAITFSTMNLTLSSNERVLYWENDSNNADLVLAATTNGLFKSFDNGENWQRDNIINGKSTGTFLTYSNNQTNIYHASEDSLYLSTDAGLNFSKIVSFTNFKVRLFTGGEDQNGITFALSDDNGLEACVWANAYISAWGIDAINNVYDNCGNIWTAGGDYVFTKTSQAAGNHLKMAENDSSTIYTTGGKEWIKQYGTKVYKSTDKGSNWSLIFNQYDWDTGGAFEPWPENLLDYSAVGLDVGWQDDGYESFAINKKNSSIIGGTGFFFLHTSTNSGLNWKSPFTEFKDIPPRSSGKKWQTRGLEVISVYRLKNHPVNKDLFYAATADIGGMVSEDAGGSFRLAKVQYNSNYDYSFDIDDDQVVYAASGNAHDWPEGYHRQPIKSAGGIYRSNDRGNNWTRLTPNDSLFNRQFLSVGYDSINNFIYGGSHTNGISRSLDNGVTWEVFNTGLPAGDKIIPQIEIDPDNGNVYALLTGDQNFTNQSSTGIYFLDVENNATSWTLLRGNVNYPPQADSGFKVWYYPTAFAIDWNSTNKETLWLVDYENNGNWLMTGVWKSSDRGDNWDRVKQLTHPTGIKIDPTNSQKVYVSASYTLDGSWGDGGQIRTIDGGDNWIRNTKIPLQQNARSLMLDPNDPSKVYYTFFGGGILHGPIDHEE